MANKGGHKRGRGRRLSAPNAPGVLAACMVLVTASAAAPAVSVNAPAPRDAEQPPAENPVLATDPDFAWQVPAASQAPGEVAEPDVSGPVIPTVFTGDIPATVLAGYRHARDLTGTAQPGCQLPLELLEAIGKVETNHARNGLVDANGTAIGPILGPVLDGNGFAVVADTDGGRLDGDTVWDRAVGPMQFLPSTWASWLADGNGDGHADPNNVFDASLAAARYLCAANRDLGTPEGLSEAIFSYNQSTSYRSLVLSWMSTYAKGTTAVPDATTLTYRPPVRVVTVNNPAAATPPTAPPYQPPTSTPPVTTPPTTPPPVTEPPTTPPPTTLPASTPEPGLVCGVTGLLGAVTGLLGGLLGSSGGGHQPNC